MTLIARCRFRKAVLYIGDSLLSRAGSHPDVIDTPAVRNINATLPSEMGRSVTGLRQKINIINDRLIVAWAGNFIQARALMREIGEAVENGASSIGDIREVIDKVPESERDDLSLIGTIVNSVPDSLDTLDLAHFDYCATKSNAGDVLISAAGSGTNSLLNTIQQLVGDRPSSDFKEDFQKSYDWLVQLGYSLTASFVGHETMSGGYIHEWWGGAFEFATIVEGKFQKFSNHLHTAWIAVPTESKKEYRIFFGTKLIKYDYFEDALAVQTLNLNVDHRNAKMSLENHSYNLYTPILKSRFNYDLSKFNRPNLDHNTICCFIRVETPGEDPEYCVIVHQNGDEGSWFNLTVNSDEIGFSFHSELVKMLEEQVARIKGLPAKFSVTLE